MPLWLASLALRSAPLRKWIKSNWKLFAIGAAAIAGFLYFQHWKGGLVKSADAAGFARAEVQYRAAVEAANKIAQHDQQAMALMAAKLGESVANRSSDLTVKIQPSIESIKNEVANDPRYRECVVSDGVRDSLNAGRAAVDASIAAGHPPRH